MSDMIVRWDNDEQVTIVIDGDDVLSVTQNVIGWEGVQAVIGASRHVARKLGVASIRVEGAPNRCCGDPKNLDGGAHPWEHVSEDGPGDVYRCPKCGAVDVD